MDKEKEPETTWDRISHLSLPNQVQAICLCLDDALKELREVIPESETKAPKK